MSTEDGAFTIVYNGELFNADEVRRELDCGRAIASGRAATPRSSCADTPSGAAACWTGSTACGRFAVWDRPPASCSSRATGSGSSRWSTPQTPDGLVFGSEIKALSRRGSCARELDPDALPHYLSVLRRPRAVQPRSRACAGFRPAHTLTVGADGRPSSASTGTAPSSRRRTGARPRIATRSRRCSTTPCAGGWSATCPLGVLLLGRHRLAADGHARRAPRSTARCGRSRSASACPAADEREPARGAGREPLGTEHAEDTDRTAERRPSAAALLEAYDEPGQSLLQTHFVSPARAARCDGGPLGSRRRRAVQLLSHPCRRERPGPLRRPPAPRVREPALRGRSARARLALRRAAALAELPSDDRAQLARAPASDERGPAPRRCSRPSVRAELDLEAPARHLASHFERAAAHDPLNRMLYVYLKTYLADELLRATDAMSMLHSLELRTPFLDYRLVERAMAMPAHHKMRLARASSCCATSPNARLPGRRRAAASGASRHRSCTWLRGELARGASATRSSAASMRERGIFDPAAVEGVVRPVASTATTGSCQPVMMLYSFETWAQRWLDGRPAAPSHCRQPAPIDGAPSRDLSVIVVNWNTREPLARLPATRLQQHLVGRRPRGDRRRQRLERRQRRDGRRAIPRGPPDRATTENVGFGRANNQAMADGARTMVPAAQQRHGPDRRLGGAAGRDGARRAGARRRALPARLPDGRLQHTAYRFPSLRLALFEDLGLYKLVPRRASRRDPARRLLGLRRGARRRLGGRRVHAHAARGVRAHRRVRRAALHVRRGHRVVLSHPRSRAGGCATTRTPPIIHFDHVELGACAGATSGSSICLRRQRDIYRERNGPAVRGAR